MIKETQPRLIILNLQKDILHIHNGADVYVATNISSNINICTIVNMQYIFLEVQNNQTWLSFLDHFSTLLYLSPKKKNACIHVAILRLNIDKYMPYFWSVTYYDRKLYGFKCPKMTQDSVPESRNAISFSRSFVRLDDYSLSIID